ncbi:hypothetical protein DSO57_1003503 [Entomophthora muscae]|uniref:Uncharacterized protein n=1 Tax=Entomophthora muscae TaxID=34485 RepID=A0ACC2RNA5_9FUNG|nr:hypothetical protein DSO57_1003503 [Entomophthora muscae]
MSSITSSNRPIIECVLSEELVAQIRGTEFDDMLAEGFSPLAFIKKSNLYRIFNSKFKIPTIKVTLSRSHAHERHYTCRRFSYFSFNQDVCRPQL